MIKNYIPHSLISCISLNYYGGQYTVRQIVNIVHVNDCLCVCVCVCVVGHHLIKCISCTLLLLSPKPSSVVPTCSHMYVCRLINVWLLQMPSSGTLPLLWLQARLYCLGVSWHMGSTKPYLIRGPILFTQ